MDEKVAKLAVMFPTKHKEELKDLLDENQGSLTECIDELLFSQSIFKNSGNTSFDNLIDLQSHLEQKLTGSVCRINVDAGDIYQDLIGFYKSGKYTPDCRLKIVLRPAADTGGVLSQCYTVAFEMFLKEWFVPCESGAFLPTYKANVHVTKLFVILGKMISHSIFQNGPGFKFLPKSVYQYLVNGTIDETVPISVEDIADAKKKYVLNMVINVIN